MANFRAGYISTGLIDVLLKENVIWAEDTSKVFAVSQVVNSSSVGFLSRSYHPFLDISDDFFFSEFSSIPFDELLQDVIGLSELLTRAYDIFLNSNLEILSNLNSKVELNPQVSDIINLLANSILYKIYFSNNKDAFVFQSKLTMGLQLFILDLLYISQNLNAMLSIVSKDYIWCLENITQNSSGNSKSVSNITIKDVVRMGQYVSRFLSELLQLEDSPFIESRIFTTILDNLQNQVTLATSQLNSLNISRDSMEYQEALLLNFSYLQSVIDIILFAASAKTHNLVNFASVLNDSLIVDDTNNRFMAVINKLQEVISIASNSFSGLIGFTVVTDNFNTHSTGLLLNTGTDAFILDEISVNDILNYITNYLSICKDNTVLIENANNVGSLNSIFKNKLNIIDISNSNQRISSILIDILNLRFSILLDKELYQCWVLNTNELLPSIYTNFNFNSFITIGNKVYAAKEDGIYSLDESTTDNNTAINTGVSIKTDTLLTQNKKKFKVASFGISGDKPVLRVSADNSSKYTYYIINGGVDIGKGLVGKVWSFEIADINELSFIELVPLVLSR